MFNKKSEEAVKDCKLSEQFYKPHTDYNLKYLLNSILDNYGIPVDKSLPKDCFKKDKKYKHTVLIVLDGLGIELFKRNLKLMPKDIKDFLDKNLLISEVTSIFPPTTTTVIPFFMTGLLPEESGFYDWWQYEYHVDEIFCPFRNTYKNVNNEELPVDKGIDFGEVFFESKIHKELTENNVKIFSYVDPSYTTPINVISSTFANVVETRRFIEQCVKCVQNIKNNYDENTFHYLYDPNTDGAEHFNGVYAVMSFRIVENLLFEIYQLIKEIQDEKLENVQILITADHGLNDFKREDVLFLEKHIDMDKYLKKNKEGRNIGFGGSPRECILHIKEDLLDDFVKEASEVCKGYGEVFTLEMMYDNGFFNRDIVSERFERNMGNVIICAYDHKCIWFDDEKNKKFKALHGGLSYDELHVPLMSYGG